jgi:hypothetical protein
MVWNSIKDALAGEPTLPEGPTRLPDYFPVEPKGCEKHAQRLFSCLAHEATEKAREIEKAGYYKPYWPDVEAKKPDKPLPTEGEGLPKPDDNPLDECRSFIAYYKRCCDRELKKRKNWILTEPYRVQEEYRYAQRAAAASNDQP